MLNWYMSNPQAKAQKKYRAKRRKAFQAIKESSPCMDCGVWYPYYVMDFDHRDRSEKSFELSGAKYTGSWQRMMDEISKCDLVCANCHRYRTHRNKDHVV